MSVDEWTNYAEQLFRGCAMCPLYDGCDGEDCKGTIKQWLLNEVEQ